MLLQFHPMPLLKRRSPFDDPDFFFEVKYDGFRALAAIEHRRTQLTSRNGHRFSSFATLENLISAGLPDTRAVLDGEICSLDKKGRPQFKNLLFHRGNYPCFLAFDLLMCDGKDCRRERILDRGSKLEIRTIRNGLSGGTL
jgi:bifunctional non-homologous end joining protein LigD